MLIQLLTKDEANLKEDKKRGEEIDEEEEKHWGMTEDDWMVEIDDYLRANNQTMLNWLKVNDFWGIRYAT